MLLRVGELNRPYTISAEFSEPNRISLVGRNAVENGILGRELVIVDRDTRQVHYSASIGVVGIGWIMLIESNAEDIVRKVLRILIHVHVRLGPDRSILGNRKPTKFHVVVHLWNRKLHNDRM